MGGEQSSLPPRPLGFEYFCIAFRPSDKIRIIYGTDHEISIIRQIIEQSWSRGIQREQFLFNGVHEFKLKGNPFQVYTSSFDAASSRIMAGNILHRLQRDGWKLLVSSDLTRRTDLTTWIFKKAPSAAISSRPLLIVGLSSTDSLMILNAPEELHQTFKIIVENSWSRGIQKWSFENNVLVIKLYGTPWNPDGQETVCSRLLLQNLIQDLYKKQWRLYGNSNLKSSTNTLFFEYDSNIIPGERYSSFFTVSLNKQDRIRLIGAEDNLVSVVRDVLQTSWTRGIQNEENYHQSWEFKLRGTPWWASGTEAVDSRFLIAKLIEILQSYGWFVVAAIDSSRKISDKSSLVFTKSQPLRSPVFCLSLNESDKIRLINAPDDIQKVRTLRLMRIRYYFSFYSIFSFI